MKPSSEKRVLENYRWPVQFPGDRDGREEVK